MVDVKIYRLLQRDEEPLARKELDKDNLNAGDLLADWFVLLLPVTISRYEFHNKKLSI
jgi:hypothetical protein